MPSGIIHRVVGPRDARGGWGGIVQPTVAWLPTTAIVTPPAWERVASSVNADEEDRRTLPSRRLSPSGVAEDNAAQNRVSAATVHTARRQQQQQQQQQRRRQRHRRKLEARKQRLQAALAAAEAEARHEESGERRQRVRRSLAMQAAAASRRTRRSRRARTSAERSAPWAATSPHSAGAHGDGTTMAAAAATAVSRTLITGGDDDVEEAVEDVEEAVKDVEEVVEDVEESAHQENLVDEFVPDETALGVDGAGAVKIAEEGTDDGEEENEDEGEREYDEEFEEQSGSGSGSDGHAEPMPPLQQQQQKVRFAWRQHLAAGGQMHDLAHRRRQLQAKLSRIAKRQHLLQVAIQCLLTGTAMHLRWWLCVAASAWPAHGAVGASD
eukprot:COSAG01_NODE_1494_length_10125_cov_93.590805_4_plen_382_part_00